MLCVRAAFEKEIEGLPTTRSVGDLPPELRCPLCKEVMKDAVLTSKCCFRSFCDKCKLAIKFPTLMYAISIDNAYNMTGPVLSLCIYCSVSFPFYQCIMMFRELKDVCILLAGIRDYIINKSVCVCGATSILADDLLPNKTLRETISRILEAPPTSSTENVGSMVQVQGMFIYLFVMRIICFDYNCKLILYLL
jgi:E3 ubiquitin-protein ligase RBBP6